MDVERGDRLLSEVDVLRCLLEQRTAELRACESRLGEREQRIADQVREEVARSRINDHHLIVRTCQAAMGEFIGHLAHQWRQPLSAISLLIQDLGETYVHGEFSGEYLENTVSTTVEIIQQMSQSINDIRDFFKRDEEKVDFGVRDILERSLTFITSSLRFSDTTVDTSVDEGLTVTGYPNGFFLALLHIFEFSKDIPRERNTAKPLIRIDAFNGGNKTVITITDNYGGISDGISERIFDPYETAWKTGNGTGLGFYLSKIIIEQNMGGRLTASSVEDGVQFLIEI